MIDQLLQLAQVLPASARSRVERLLGALPRSEMVTLLAEVKAAARAARDAESRVLVVDRLLRRIAMAAGIELSNLEVAALRSILLRFFPIED